MRILVSFLALWLVIMSSPTWARKTSAPPPQSPWPEAEVSIVVDLGRQKAWLYRRGEVVKDTVVCTGRKGKSTPRGDFDVVAKHRKWRSTIYGTSMPFFLRLTPWTIGLHQGEIKPYPASNGCIRLPSDTAKIFFETAPVGTKVRVQ